jgi:tyrosyl-tRNA synthetase
MSLETANSNVSKIKNQVDQLFQVSVRKYAASHGYKESAVGTISVLNNVTWWEKFSLTDFMHKVARNMRVSRMCARDRYNSCFFQSC